MSTVLHLPRVGAHRHVPLPHVGTHGTWLLLAFVLLAGLLASSIRAGPEAKAVTTIDNATAAWSLHDPYAVSRLYSEDAVLSTADGRVLVGSDAMAAEAARVAPFDRVIWRSGPVAVDGDLATASIAYSMTDGSRALTIRPEITRGTLQSEFQLEDGKIVRQWDSSSG